MLVVFFILVRGCLNLGEVDGIFNERSVILVGWYRDDFKIFIGRKGFV